MYQLDPPPAPPLQGGEQEGAAPNNRVQGSPLPAGGAFDHCLPAKLSRQHRDDAFGGVGLLIDQPGRRLSTVKIRRLAPDVFDSDYAIAGSIKGLAKATAASGRRYPFYWWKERPTSYAMKPGVAAVFAAARDRVGR